MKMTTITVSEYINCSGFPCVDVDHSQYLIPTLETDPSKITTIVISEAAPPDSQDHYYASEGASFANTTLSVFQTAGFDVKEFSDLLEMGIYCTPAVKCGKTGYAIKAATIKNCSLILEEELALFSNVKAYMLMGDVAIKAANYINKRQTGERAIPAGSTYKIRGGSYTFLGKPAFPSYLQVGPSFGIEKSKQRMIVEDLQRMKKLL
jgi:uracil-DNA glycosylase